MSKGTPGVGDIWKDPCGQELYIGSLGQQKVYLNWQDVKDICTKEVSEAYEQTKRENDKLKELLKECELWFTDIVGNMNNKNVGEHNRNLPIGNFEHIFKVFSQKINQALGEDK